MAKGRARTGASKQGKGARASKTSFTSRDDIPMNDVERFDAARDKILLDDAQYEPDHDEEEFGAHDREVLAFSQEQEESDDEDEDQGGEDVEEDEEEDDRYATMQIPSSSVRKAESNARRAPRDDAHGSDSDGDESHSDSDDAGWGANKRAYYSGNTGAALESDSEVDEDKAHELEIAEAIRLQRLSRAGMDDREFGLDTIDAEEAQINADEQSAAARAKRKRDLDGSSTTAPTSVLATPDELVAQLQKRAPLVLALVDELESVLGQVPEANAYVEHVTAHGERQVAEIAHLYAQTLSCYATVLCFFFQLASTPAMAADPDRLLQHPVMDRLSQLKKALVEMRALGLFDPEDTYDDDEREMAGLIGPPTDEDRAYEDLSDLSENELHDLVHDEKENQATEQEPAAKSMAPVAPSRRDASRRRKAKALERGESVAPAPLPLAAVATVGADGPSTRRAGRFESLESADAYGEPVHLRSLDAQDKAARKRATQFHSAASADAGRTKAVRLEGDQDIPYRDRQRSRDAVAAAKSSKVAKKMPAADPTLSNAEWGDEDWQDRQDVMDSAMPPATPLADDDDAAYYDLISSNKRARKAAKKEAYDEERLASRVAEADALAPGEHRLIDRTIEKNKGLTPHRPKSVRNPRVKRRMKYDKASKRLSSTRAVYKGGQNALQGGYQGEKSGISTHLVKSRKLGS